MIESTMSVLGALLIVITGAVFAATILSICSYVQNRSSNLRIMLRAVEHEIDELMLLPDFDLPSYEGKALRKDVRALERKARVLRNGVYGN